MATPTANVADVKEVIDTSLSDSDITSALEYAAFRVDEENPSQNFSTEHRTRLEANLAAWRIRTTKERPFSSQSAANRSVSYQGNEISTLRAAVSELDPSGNLASVVARDTNRFVGSTGE